MTEEDLVIRRHILNIMCTLETSWEDPKMQFPELQECLQRLNEMQSDGLMEIKENQLVVKEAGRSFIRNIAMAFDLRMIRKQPQTRIFSMTI